MSISRAPLYTECCALLFAESQYDEAFRHCSLAMKELSVTLPQKAVVDVLRQCSKVREQKINLFLRLHGSTVAQWLI